MLPFDPVIMWLPTAFFIVIAVVAIVPMWLSHRRRLEVQKTLQLAIEKGQTLDPAVVEKLLSGSVAGRGRGGGARGGVVTLFSGLGLIALGAIMGGLSWGQYVMGPGALVALIGAGRIASHVLFKPPGSLQGPTE